MVFSWVTDESSGLNVPAIRWGNPRLTLLSSPTFRKARNVGRRLKRALSKQSQFIPRPPAGSSQGWRWFLPASVRQIWDLCAGR
jgi:hypothetical protein